MLLVGHNRGAMCSRTQPRHDHQVEWHRLVAARRSPHVLIGGSRDGCGLGVDGRLFGRMKRVLAPDRRNVELMLLVDDA